MLTPSHLAPVQRASIKDIFRQKKCAITSGCGYGKSIVGLSCIKIAYKKWNKPTLVVGNKEAVTGTWSNEYKNWSHTKNFKVVVLTGTPNERLHKLKQKAHIYVVSYNLLKWLTENNHHRFGMVIADEATCLKGGNSKWRKQLEKLSTGTHIRLALTATPKTREENDYYGLAHWLDGGKALGATYTSFQERYMKSFSLPKGGKVWSMKNQQACQDVRDAVKHLFIEYPLTDKAVIPIVEKRMYGTLTPKANQMYTEFRDSGVLAGHEIRDGRPLNAVEIINLTSQLSSGFVYDDMQMRIDVAELKAAKSALDLLKKKKRVVIRLFDDRINYLKKLLMRIKKLHGDQNVLICYHFKHELEQLQTALPGAVPDTANEFEKRWNEGKIKYGLLQYNRSSKSLNLQKGGHIMVFYSQSFNWEDTYQIPRRLARQGQQAEKVYLYILHLRDTTDDLKAEKLNGRSIGHKKMQQMIMRQVRNDG